MTSNVPPLSSRDRYRMMLQAYPLLAITGIRKKIACVIWKCKRVLVCSVAVSKSWPGSICRYGAVKITTLTFWMLPPRSVRTVKNYSDLVCRSVLAVTQKTQAQLSPTGCACV